MNHEIYLYDNAEVLDFSGPFEVFSTAKRLGAKNWNVFLVSELMEPVVAREGYRVLPHYSFENHPEIDVLVVAGGIYTEEVNKANVLEWIISVDQTAKWVVSVCTGAFLLAQVGLLNGLAVTTHWEDIPDLRQNFPKVIVLENKRWVHSGKYITSGGISAGIDMSLHLVSQLYSQELADQVAHQMEYDWQKNR